MKILFNNLMIVLSIVFISSCTPSAPYEIRSPCVSIKSDSFNEITPCVRRPVNLEKAVV